MPVRDRQKNVDVALTQFCPAAT